MRATKNAGKGGQRLHVLMVIAFCVAIDQATKGMAAALLPSAQIFSFAGDLVRLQYAENPGAFLSLGAALSESARAALFSGLVGIALAGLVGYLIIGNGVTAPTLLPLSLIAGGGVSNLIDRILHQGHVIDFVSVGIDPVRTGIFNLADLAITTGVVLFFFSGLRKTPDTRAR